MKKDEDINAAVATTTTIELKDNRNDNRNDYLENLEISENIIFDFDKAITNDLTDIYMLVDMCLDAFCIGWLNAEVWLYERAFPSALTGQTVKIATDDKLNFFGLACIPSFCLGNMVFAFFGLHLCDVIKKEETVSRRIIFKSILEIIFIVVTLIVNTSSPLGISYMVVVMSFAAGVINGFHSRNKKTATAFMTGRVATIGTEIGLYLRNSPTKNTKKFFHNILSYAFFLSGGLSRSISGTSVAFAWPFHLKYVLEVFALLFFLMFKDWSPSVRYIPNNRITKVNSDN